MKFMKVCETAYLALKESIPMLVFAIFFLVIESPPIFTRVVVITMVTLGTIYVVFGGKK